MKDPRRDALNAAIVALDGHEVIVTQERMSHETHTQTLGRGKLTVIKNACAVADQSHGVTFGFGAVVRLTCESTRYPTIVLYRPKSPAS